ncbi:MAG: hypothetical protein PUB20_03205 [Clostridia bacterium]|nr:hypothetical protein [Clostridia bacterium]
MKMKNIKNLYIIAAILQIISAVLWFVPSFDGVKYIMSNSLGEVTGVSIRDYTLFEYFDDMRFISVASIIGMALSCILLLIPIFKKTCEKRHRLIYSKITAIYSLVIFCAAFYSIYDGSMEYSYIGGKSDIFFGGIALIAVSVAFLALLFVISIQTNKLSKQAKLQNIEDTVIANK